MGGAAGFFLELMLFIGFKYKLNMTVRFNLVTEILFILITQHNISSLALKTP